MNETRGKSEDQTLRTRGERLAETLSLPRDLILGAPVLTCVGSMSVTVENHRGITALETDLIEIKGGNAALRIRGEDLVLKAMNRTELLITGRLFSVELE